MYSNNTFNNNNAKIKDDISKLINNLILELNQLENSYKTKINNLNIEKENNRENIIKKYSTLYMQYFDSKNEYKQSGLFKKP